MTAPNLLDELEGVVRLCDKASAMLPSAEGTVAIKEAETAATNWVITHHATLADMAKRLEAAERDAARYRWLRDNIRKEGRGYRMPEVGTDQVMIRPLSLRFYVDTNGLRYDTLDAAIDAATQEGEG